jgi:hypothetical protein
MVLKEENAGVLTMSSVHTPSWFGFDKYEHRKGTVEAHIHRSFLYCQYISPTESRVKVICNADPHVAFIPQRVINWALKHVIGLFLTLLQKRSVNLSKEYVALIKEKRAFYQTVRNKLGQIAADNMP